MTPQFKFGDMVRHKKYGIGVISYVKDGNIDFYVSFKDDSRFDAWINGESLELIPHPDTVRLDWIIKNGGEIQDSDGYVRFCIDPDVTPDLVENTRKCREAIDAVMQG